MPFFFSKKHLWTLILNAPTQCFWSLRNCHEICCERLNDTSPPGLLLWNPLRTFSISISPVQAYGQWLTSIDTIAQGCPKPIAPSPSQDIQPIRAWDYQCNIPECGYLYHQKKSRRQSNGMHTYAQFHLLLRGLSLLSSSWWAHAQFVVFPKVLKVFFPLKTTRMMVQKPWVHLLLWHATFLQTCRHSESFWFFWLMHSFSKVAPFLGAVLFFWPHIDYQMLPAQIQEFERYKDWIPGLFPPLFFFLFGFWPVES